MFTLIDAPLPPPALQRREFLRLGGLTGVGLTLPALLSGQARAGTTRSAPAKSCLLIFMEGGPSQIDLFDLKPNAPVEVRGQFRPIATTVPGMQVCELLPLLSRHMHRLAQVRSVAHTITDHNAGSYYMLTGRSPVDGSRLIVADGPRNFPVRRGAGPTATIAVARAIVRSSARVAIQQRLQHPRPNGRLPGCRLRPADRRQSQSARAFRCLV